MALYFSFFGIFNILSSQWLMTILSSWFLIFSVLFTVFGFSLYYYNRKSIIISKRRPTMVIFENLFVMILLITTSLNLDNISVISCGFNSALVGITAIVPMMLIITRSSYVYQILIDKTHKSKFGLDLICRFFWRTSNKLKLNNLLGIISFLIIIDISIIFTSGEVCDDHNFALYIDYVLFLTLIFFCIQFVRYRIVDHIWMSLEMELFTLFEVICIVVIMSLAYGVDISYQAWLPICQGFISVFFELYFPLILLFQHQKRTANKGPMDKLNDPRVYDLCKKFYCEENGLFIKDYSLYKSNSVPLNHIISRYFQSNAPHLLNVSFELRSRVLNDDKNSELYLDQAYEEICQIVLQNIVPYLDSEESNSYPQSPVSPAV